MSEEELRKHRCCFTGHRPDKLKIPERQLAVLLEREIREAVDRQFTTFITGMAKGTDLIAAEIVLRLREHDSRLKLIAALPYPNFGLHWGGGWTERFQHVLTMADLTRTICPRFSYSSYQASATLPFGATTVFLSCSIGMALPTPVIVFPSSETKIG